MIALTAIPRIPNPVIRAPISFNRAASRPIDAWWASMIVSRVDLRDQTVEDAEFFGGGKDPKDPRGRTPRPRPCVRDATGDTPRPAAM
ncbi:MAG: hypothetical protein AABZ30_01420 [Myxococcota bacterium]